MTVLRPLVPTFGRRALLAMAASLALAGPALAQVPVIASTPTNLASSVERMISYRHQEHMWQTADGALHVLMNRGKLTPSSGLTLWTSTDGGSNWVAQQSWPDANYDSTGDGQLRGDLLDVAYNTAVGAIAYNQLRWDTATGAWTLLQSETVFTPADFVAENPTIAVDALGTTWVTYVTTEVATGSPRIRLSSRAAGASPWVDTGLTFGEPGAAGTGRSARLLQVAGGMAMLYKIDETLIWATRNDAAPASEPWVATTLFVSPPPAPRDPNASHFSIVTDSQGALHLVMADDGKLYYFKYTSRRDGWGSGRVLDSKATVSYCQISIGADDRLMVVYNDSAGDSKVMQSLNRGRSFTSVALLRPTPVDGASYTFSRIETPSRSTLPLPVLRQFSESRQNKLMLFTVPFP